MPQFVRRKVGHYKLPEVIGKGDMDIVYVAEQSEPVRGQMALKLIERVIELRTTGYSGLPVGSGTFLNSISRF